MPRNLCSYKEWVLCEAHDNDVLDYMSLPHEQREVWA